MKSHRLPLLLVATLALAGAQLDPARAGTLSAMFTPLANVTTPIDLTAEGQTDWAFWGLYVATDFDQKWEGTGAIGTYTRLGTGETYGYGNSTTPFSWTDGTPDSVATAVTTGIFFPGVDHGFEIDVAADTTPRLFNIYVGAWAARIHFEASLSDGSAPAYIDETYSHDRSGGPNRRYSIIYAANSAGQTLKIRAWVISTVDVGGNVTLQAATLRSVPPLSVTPPTVTPAQVVAAGTKVTLTTQAEGAFPYHYQWWVDHGSGFAPVPNSDTNSLVVDTAPLSGAYTYKVAVANDSGEQATSDPVSLTVNVNNGLLQVSSDNLAGITEVNLTAEGTLDWAHWGLIGSADFDQKATGNSQISTYTPIGTALSYYQYGNNAQGFTWTDGSPTPTADRTTTGVYAVGQGNGFEINVQAQQTNLLFNLYVGVYTPGGNLASLYLEASLSDDSAPIFIDESLSGVANRRYSFLFAAGSPNQTLRIRFWVVGASDGNVTLQAATLKAVPPLSVTQPTLWPTNTLALGSTAKLSGEAQGPFPYSYQWQVDSGAGFVAIPNSDTNLLYVTPTATGAYSYRLIVTNTSAQAATSAPVTLTMTAPTSTLVISSRDAQGGETIDLTAEGTLDWAHWGLTTATDFDHRDGVTPQISNYSPVGTATFYGQYGNNGVGFTWSDGTPNIIAENSTSGLWVAGLGNGYEIQVPAAKTPRVLKLYVGAWQARGHFDVAWSDGSGPFYFDETFDAFGSQNRVYTVTYAAPNATTPPPNLIVRYWMIGGAGNVTLNSASLAAPVTLTLQPVANGQLQLTWPEGILLESTSLAGPWTTNANTSPYTFIPSGPQKFFRAQIR